MPKKMTKEASDGVREAAKAHLNDWARGHGTTFESNFGLADVEGCDCLIVKMVKDDGGEGEVFANRRQQGYEPTKPKTDLWLSALIMHAIRGDVLLPDGFNKLFGNLTKIRISIVPPTCKTHKWHMVIPPEIDRRQSSTLRARGSRPALTQLSISLVISVRFMTRFVNILAQTAELSTLPPVADSTTMKRLPFKTTNRTGSKTVRRAVDVIFAQGIDKLGRLLEIAGEIAGTWTNDAPPSTTSRKRTVANGEGTTDSGSSSPPGVQPQKRARAEIECITLSDDEEEKGGEPSPSEKEDGNGVKEEGCVEKVTANKKEGSDDKCQKIGQPVGKPPTPSAKPATRPPQPTTIDLDGDEAGTPLTVVRPKPVLTPLANDDDDAIIDPPGPSSSGWYQLPTNAVIDMPMYDPALVTPAVSPLSYAPMAWLAPVDMMYPAQCISHVINNGGKRHMDVLTHHITHHYEVNIQDDKTFNTKMMIRERLLQAACASLRQNDLGMQAVGSTVNGCGAYSSDMDLCLLVPDRQGKYNLHRQSAVTHLRTLMKYLRNQCRYFVANSQVIPARVPIIKLTLRPPHEILEVDINVNNIAGIYNSHLCHHYSTVDLRFPMLVLLVKHWAINANVNDAMVGTFNSYSLVLLVVHFLQCAVSPPVLPNLQALYPNMFTMRRPVNALGFNEQFPFPPIDPNMVNKQSVGELLVGLFAYFSSFAWAKHSISIRLGCLVKRSAMSPSSSSARNPVYVEEPYDYMNTARACREEFFNPSPSPGCVNVPREFQKAHRMLQNGGSLSQIGVDCGL